MANKIKKISIGGQDALEVYDVEAAHTINGYPAKDFVVVGDAAEPAVTFANKAISTAEIEKIFTTQASTEGGN